MLTDHVDYIKILLRQPYEDSQKFSFKNNINKTKFTTINKNGIPETRISIIGEGSEEVTELKSIGWIINQKWDLGEEIKLICVEDKNLL